MLRFLNSGFLQEIRILIEPWNLTKVRSPSFVIGGSQIEIVEKTKYLGIQLDQHLIWDEHTRFVRAKVSRAMGFLNYAKKILPQETLSQI